jgi:uncharacterized protein DUF4232
MGRATSPERRPNLAATAVTDSASYLACIQRGSALAKDGLMNSCATLTRRIGGAAAAAGLAGLAVVISACGSSPATSAPPASSATSGTAPPAGASSASGTPSVAASTSPATTSTAQAGLAGCVSSELQAKLGQSQGAAGTIYQVVVLTNTSNSACTLDGYPGVSFVTGEGGRVIGAPATRNTAIGDVPVTLQPGGKASTLVGVEDVGALTPAKCRPGKASWLQVYAPGDTGALYVQYSSEVCTDAAQKFMTDGAVRPGTSGGA